MAGSFVAVAGATGGLGKLLVKELRNRNVFVKAFVRPGIDPTRTEGLSSIGASVVPVDLSDVAALTRELQGATCVVSTLQGLENVMHIAQGNLLDAAVASKVPRFIPSDFSLDFTKTTPGSNRNLDLRRQFHAQLEKSGIAWTSILNGGFMDLLGPGSQMIDHKSRKVTYVGKATQLLDLTSMADTATYTAAVAADPNPTPNYLRIAGDVVSAQDIANAETEVEGTTYELSWMGSVWFLEFVIRILRLFEGEDHVLPAWQGMQYMANMFSGAGKLEPLDNDRYPEVKWTKVVDYLKQGKALNM